MLTLRKEGYEWYEAQRQNLGIEFIDEIDAVINKIEETPQRYKKVYKNIRRALCKRFPFAVFFMDKNQYIVVIGVLHQRRQPRVWQARK
ncbi:ParE toxin of type II toxin-antitoxin system, parDE [Nitrosomonas marina]|uniref:ParE toxin of type II toxin-antitoxin system, parDE n=1 Tax=Nitrosomonas marina TaxID=917 RepID=A0A1I0EDB8_9PROT|nr:type II toxin-antitoxin system RelE/ParE family toxin [Nitrosomonas marina]SET43055.1 ParE toxin of type II toxin-antitoxin system, parDE [Nitrosomonas marina]